jgi:hypothetical protein
VTQILEIPNRRYVDATRVGHDASSSAVYEFGAYRGEALAPIAADYFRALGADTLAGFTTTAHPELVIRG